MSISTSSKQYMGTTTMCGVGVDVNNSTAPGLSSKWEKFCNRMEIRAKELLLLFMKCKSIANKSRGFSGRCYSFSVMLVVMMVLVVMGSTEESRVILKEQSNDDHHTLQQEKVSNHETLITVKGKAYSVNEPKWKGEAANVSESVPRAIVEAELLVDGHRGGGHCCAHCVLHIRCTGVVPAIWRRQVNVATKGGKKIMRTLTNIISYFRSQYSVPPMRNFSKRTWLMVKGPK